MHFIFYTILADFFRFLIAIRKKEKQKTKRGAIGREAYPPLQYHQHLLLTLLDNIIKKETLLSEQSFCKGGKGEGREEKTKEDESFKDNKIGAEKFPFQPRCQNIRFIFFLNPFLVRLRTFQYLIAYINVC